MKRVPISLVALIALVAATAGIAAGVVVANRDDDYRVRMGPGMMYPESGNTPGWWDESWNSRMGPMMMGSFASSSEPEFLVAMTAHHREAVAAAGELARSERPQMRALGKSIVKSQSAQIEQMTSWLADWYPDRSTRSDYRPMMRDLSDLSGDRLDETFLQDMIGHHMLAVMMSQHRLWQGVEHEDVARLARSIRDDQHAEIIQMQRWLSEWFDTDWHGGMFGGQGMGPGMMRGSGG